LVLETNEQLITGIVTFHWSDFWLMDAAEQQGSN
jgi:hypothetical protein